ncbi:NAD-dependent epimerase/dehydratase family protein [Nisaea denitrificans]|uniref:NAD-dependent epimerase/dehydratase family protein n=1 Tax=Nisaea denitrificans TaxID=390877 RepID=UPI000414AB4A|nr:NAD(P)-dependent oxidoreductase [Nisaea denitrificans]
MKRILLTGAGGGIGRRMRQALAGAYPILRVSDMVDLGSAGDGEEIAVADLTRAEDLERIVDGVDGIIHLGGLSVENAWDDILRTNIDGAYRLFEAAYNAGVKRIVFASSNHAIGFYPRGQILDGSERPRPDCRYGLSKVFGEGLSQYFADNYGLGILSIRIGWCFEKPETQRTLGSWVSIGDLTQLCRIGLEVPDLHHEIVYGMSDNSRTWWDNKTARRLGYRPNDSSDVWAAEVDSSGVPEPGDEVGLAVQGGPFASEGYQGDPRRVAVQGAKSES